MLLSASKRGIGNESLWSGDALAKQIVSMAKRGKRDEKRLIESAPEHLQP